MFSFMKKDKEKDKEKKDKKKQEKDDKKDKKERQNMTPDEMSRIEEMKKGHGILRRFSEKDKKRPSKNYDRASPSEDGSGSSRGSPSISRGSPDKGVIRSGSNASTDNPDHDPRPILTRPQPLPRSDSRSKVPPSVAPKPKGRSILKGDASKSSSRLGSDNLDDSTILQENTKLNEDMFEEELSTSRRNPIAMTQQIPDIEVTPIEEPVDKYAEFSAKLTLPAIAACKPPRIREIIVKRSKAGGFGFSLRKGLIQDRSGGQPRVVTFAEPGSGASISQTGLLPGDRLIEVNGQNVESMSREEVVEVIKESTDTLTLKVQPIPELIELSVRPSSGGTDVAVQEDAVVKTGTLRRSGSMRYTKKPRSEDDVLTEKAWLETEKVWLIHRGGFSEAVLLQGGPQLAEGRVRVRLEAGDVIEVDEDDIEKANPPQFDRAEDLASLRYLNESSALHTLRQRYASNLVHTYAGPYLCVVNPMQQLPIYAEKIIQMLKGCRQEDMPPHVFSMGQVLYRDMLSQRKDQSLLLLGKSGSGKTTTAQHVIHYLISAAGNDNSRLNVEKLASVYTLLHAFGNSRTALNVSASRFTLVLTLDFDHSGSVGSASVQALMFEKSRVVRRPEGEPTFSVFYQMLAGADPELRSELHLGSLSDSNPFMSPPHKADDKHRAAEAWGRVLAALTSLGVTLEEVKAIICVLGAVYHLGNAGAMRGPNNKSTFSKPASAQKAASLLGVSAEELGKSIFTSGGTSTLGRSSSLRVTSMTERPSYSPHDSSATPLECLEGFVIGLYSDVFNTVVSLINRSLASSTRAMNTITIVDSPGFQTAGGHGGSRSGGGATFEDLCHNYTQERLNAFFHELALAQPIETYAEEEIELDFDPVLSNPSAIINLLDKPPAQGLMRSSTSDLKNGDKKGLLWILDEEAVFPGATEDSFMQRLLQHHSQQPSRKDSLLRKGSLGHTFILNHSLGTSPVQYNAVGWLKAARENPTSRNANILLQDSKKPNISDLFTSLKGQMVGLSSGSSPGMEGSTSLKRVGSMRRTFVSGQAGLKKKSVCLQVKFNVDSILDILKKTSVHFIHCVLPHHWAGLGEGEVGNDNQVMNVPLVRNQLRGAQILDAIRLYRQGFPDSMSFQDFVNKFSPLVPGSKGSRDDSNLRVTVSMILEHLDVDKLSYRVGTSRVFFRPGSLGQLDTSRDEKFTGVVEQFQALCRGYLGRRGLERLKLQHKAIKCIQRNVQKYVQIREWEWWRLYTKVKPILNVHRTEEELKEKEEEIEQLKTRNEKLDKERVDYKTQCDRLDNRLTEVSADLQEEHTTSGEAADLLEAETAERLRLDKELRDLQNKLQPLKRQNEKLQMELMQTRLWQAEADQEDIDGGDETDSVYKPRYERLVRELQVTKKTLQQQHEEEMEQELGSRKLIERRLHEAVEEAEEQRRQVTVAKKKTQRLATETQDMKLHLEDNMGRNNELERKQRRFDNELSMAHEDVKEEKALREKLQREKDGLLSDTYRLEQSVQTLKMESQGHSEKNERLEREVTDLMTSNKDNTEAVSLKRSKHDLEVKLTEQEEELDDQAGQIQQLEQAKLRLEMSLEKAKQQGVKDIEEKDEEMEEMRYKTQKKLRQMESQLEEEYEQKKRLMEEKGGLERRLMEGAREGPRDRESEKRLRRNLRKTKALLNDAGAALLKQKDLEGARTQISQLRNQLDDAEFTSAAALKAKKRMELEIQELQQQMEDLTRGKQEAESRSMSLLREKADLTGRLEEVEEDLNDVMKKYRAAVGQQTTDQITLQDQVTQIEELTAERDRYRQEASDLQTRMSTYDETMVDKHTVLRLETKVREMESRLDLEHTTRQRLESQLSRLKESCDRVTGEKEEVTQAKMALEEGGKRSSKMARELREELGDTQKREMEASQRVKEMETRVEELEASQLLHQSDLKLALKRITDLQAALEEDLDDDSDVMTSDSEDDDDSDPEDLSSFLSHRRRLPSSSGMGPSTDA